MDMKSLCLCVLVLSLQFVCGQYSTTPCPGVFDFEDDGQHVYGIITLQPGAPLSTLALRTNFTIASQIMNDNYVGRLDAVNTNSLLQRYNQGQAISYLVHFPVTSPLPKLTALTVNGDTICYGRGDLARSNEYVTTISLQHTSFLQRGGDTGPVHDNLHQHNQNDHHQHDHQHEHHQHDHQHEHQPQTRPQPHPQDSGEAIRQTAVNHIHIGEDDASAHIYTFKNIEPTWTADNSPTRLIFQSRPSYENEPAFQATRRPIPVRSITPVYVEPTPVSRPNPNDYYPPDQLPVVTSRLGSKTPDETIECGTVSGGNNRFPLIYNGDAYDRGELPWLVAIYKLQQDSLRFVCAGTLVSDRHVVTAAQCMQRRGTLTAIKDIVVKVGVHNLKDWSDDITITRTLQAATVHEAYDPVTLQNDILMLTLDKSVKFNQYIRPACLWSGNTDLSVIVGRKGVVAGWGDQGVGGIGRQDEPHKVNVPIISTDDCRASKARFHELTYHNTLCAGDQQGSGPCLGDSGGGMYLLQDGKWRVRGVVSVSLRSDYGDFTCNLNKYVVFTDTAQFLPWIQNILAQN